MHSRTGFTTFMRTERGFTLVELLITITIIAILSAIALVSYTTFVKNARDAKRQSDLKFIQSALEQYHADQKYYPSGPTIGGQLNNATGAPPGTSVTKVYMSTIPSDPTKNPDYLYQAFPNLCDNTTATKKCTSYCLYAQMESATLTSDPACTSLPTGFSAPKAYGVTRP